MPEDKKKNKNQPNKPKNQKASGLANANHFYETAEELANRHIDQQAKTQKRQQQEPNPEDPER